MAKQKIQWPNKKYNGQTKNTIAKQKNTMAKQKIQWPNKKYNGQTKNDEKPNNDRQISTQQIKIEKHTSSTKN